MMVSGAQRIVGGIVSITTSTALVLVTDPAMFDTVTE